MRRSSKRPPRPASTGAAHGAHFPFLLATAVPYSLSDFAPFCGTCNDLFGFGREIVKDLSSADLVRAGGTGKIRGGIPANPIADPSSAANSRNSPEGVQGQLKTAGEPVPGHQRNRRADIDGPRRLSSCRGFSRDS